MRILPVLDLKGGVVVRGVGGRRDAYQPVVSRLTDSSRPEDVALAFRSHFDLSELYVADLEAIAGSRPAVDLFASLRQKGFRLCVDAGIRTADTAGPLLEAGVERIVVGLETVAGPAELAELCRRHADRIVFSLDTKDGNLLGDLSAWPSPHPFRIAGQAVGVGVRRLIVLDLARVGSGAGTGTEDFCGRLASAFPDVELFAGGGVRNLEDLRRLQQGGVAGVLLASALHDGRLTREDVRSLAGAPFVSSRLSDVLLDLNP